MELEEQICSDPDKYEKQDLKIQDSGSCPQLCFLIASPPEALTLPVFIFPSMWRA
jgi:hypothetical protein